MMSISFTERPLFTKQLFCNSGNFTVKFVIVNFFLFKKQLPSWKGRQLFYMARY